MTPVNQAHVLVYLVYVKYCSILIMARFFKDLLLLTNLAHWCTASAISVQVDFY